METEINIENAKADIQFSNNPADFSLQSLKIPPHSIEAEQAVLGGLMLDSSAWDQIADRIKSIDFYRRDHGLIFQAISGLAAQSRPIDVITVSEVYTDLAYLGALAKSTPSAANIVAYADIVKEKSLLRKLIEVGEEISELGFNSKGQIAKELVDEAERKVFAIAEQKLFDRHGIKTIAEVLTNTIERIEVLSESDSPITGMSSGFMDFDKLTSGLQRADLIIVAGRPSMGKTTFAMNIAEWISMKSDKPVLIFSMEMPAEQLAMRMLASLARIELQRIRNGQLHDEDWPRLSAAIAMMASRKMFIDDSGSLSPIEVRARARRLMREQGELGLIVVDYLQLMKVPGNNEHRAAEISEISRSLKTLARELNVPVIALSQLNRSLEQRTDRRPIMSDLRESGAIEQDADLITFIYRDEMYNKDTADKGTAEIIIAKQRNGPTGMMRLTFLGHFSRFENFTQQIQTPLNSVRS
jgi:replicative DNA helicase